MVIAGHALCPAILYSACLLILDEFSFDFNFIYIFSCKTIVVVYIIFIQLTDYLIFVYFIYY